MVRLTKSMQTLKRARRLRAEMTEPERLLWMLLRDRRFADHKFRRQVPLGDYVVDFVCFNPKLVLELDGAHHLEAEQAAFDAERTRVLNQAGFRVARIFNAHLYLEREGALTEIYNALKTAEREG